jgi:hypothetical protein
VSSCADSDVTVGLGFSKNQHLYFKRFQACRALNFMASVWESTCQLFPLFLVSFTQPYCRHHTILLTTSGTLYGFGKNAHAQLGPALIGEIVVPSRLPVFTGSYVRLVATSAVHTCAVLEDGSVWSFDTNNGQLGLSVRSAVESKPVSVIFH